MKKKVLCIVQLPPPVHGASLMNSSFVNSPLINEHYLLKVINVATAGNIEGIGKFSVKKIFDSAGHFFRIAATLVFYRPGLVYFTFSPTGFAFYRDAIYTGLVKLSGTELAIHLHGKGIRAGYTGNRLRDWICQKVFTGTNVIFLSGILAGDMDGFAYKRKFIVNCGIPLTEPPPESRPAGNLCRLLFLSNYVRSKGIIDLIDAIAIVARTNQHFHLRLVGKPYDVSIDELKEHIARKGLDSLITICGPKYQGEKLSEFRQADVFIFPTYYTNEAFPLVLLEAMQWALPSITTREGGIPDIIDNGVTGMLIDQRDITQLAENILFLIGHAEERRKMGQAARKIFLEKFTLATFEKNMLQAFSDILEKHAESKN